MMIRPGSRLPLLAIASVLLFSASGAGAYEQELRSLSEKMAERIAAEKKSTLAVVDFTDLQGNVTALGRFLAEEFSVALADSGRGFRVVDRTHLASILREHKLSESGLIDPATARKLGQITGVEALITGTITPFGDSVRIAVKILDTETATIIGSATGNIPKTGAIADLLSQEINSPAPSAQSAPALKSQQTITSDDFEFALQRCAISGTGVKCFLIITNEGADRELYIGSNSRAFDEYGREYTWEGGRLGNNSGSSFRNILIAGIPTESEIRLSGAAPEVKQLKVLELNCYHFKVQFRDIPLSR